MGAPEMPDGDGSAPDETFRATLLARTPDGALSTLIITRRAPYNRLASSPAVSSGAVNVLRSDRLYEREKLL